MAAVGGPRSTRNGRRKVVATARCRSGHPGRREVRAAWRASTPSGRPSSRSLEDTPWRRAKSRSGSVRRWPSWCTCGGRCCPAPGWSGSVPARGARGAPGAGAGGRRRTVAAAGGKPGRRVVHRPRGGRTRQAGGPAPRSPRLTHAHRARTAATRGDHGRHRGTAPVAGRARGSSSGPTVPCGGRVHSGVGTPGVGRRGTTSTVSSLAPPQVTPPFLHFGYGDHTLDADGPVLHPRPSTLDGIRPLRGAMTRSKPERHRRAPHDQRHDGAWGPGTDRIGSL